MPCLAIQKVIYLALIMRWSNCHPRAITFFQSAGVATKLLLMAVIWLSMSLAFNAQAQTTLRVGVYHNPPKFMLDEAGEPSGIFGELVREIAAQEGWQLEPVRCEWQQCLQLLQSGQIDLMPDVAFTDNRDQRFAFHQKPMLLSWSQLYHSRDSAISSLIDLDGKTVAFLDDSVQVDYLQSIARNFELNITWLALPTLEQGFAAVVEGQADAVAANHFFGNQKAYELGLIASPIVFQPARLFIAARPDIDPAILTTIDTYVINWQADNQSFYYRVIERWTAHQTMNIPNYVVWLAAVLITCLVLALLMSLWLKRQVAQQTRQLRDSEARLNTILNSVEAYIYIKGLDRHYQYANRKVTELLGTTQRDIVGMNDRSFFDEETAARLERNDRRVIDLGERVVDEEINTVAQTGEKRYFLSVKLPLRDSHGDIYALCGISTDITEHQEVQNELHQLSFYDPLTGLANRRLMIDKLNHALAGHIKTGYEGAVLMLDVDGFKIFNDTVGHELGDKLIQQLAQRINQSLRSTDAAARLSADDFMILLEDLSTDPEQALVDARDFAAKLQRILAEPYQLGALRHNLTVTIGVTLFSDAQGQLEQLLKAADLALTEAKAQGANQIRFFNPQMQTQVQRRTQIETRLRRAIQQRELVLHLQPQVDSVGHIVGMEGLLRWQDEELGDLSPDQFIPIAESSGLIIQLGDWVIQRACELLQNWQNKPHLQQLSLAVNVSAKQFRHPSFVAHVLAMLKQFNIQPNLLELEITETVLIEDVESAIAKMKQLQAKGIRFALDDFGTGYASLTYLKRMPFYQLKIDRSFVEDIDIQEHQADQAIVQTIVALGQSLGMTVIAEGVETEAQYERLRGLGVTHFQGYYFGRPALPSFWHQQLEQIAENSKS